MYRCRYFSCLSSSKSCCSTRKHMAGSRDRGRYVKETSRGAAEKEREKNRSGAREHGGEFDVKGEKLCGVGRAESAQRKPPTRNAVLEIFLIFAETPLQPGEQESKKGS